MKQYGMRYLAYNHVDLYYMHLGTWKVKQLE